MSDIFSRLRNELDEFGDRVKDAVESSRLHLERSGLVGRRSKLAYQLGMMVYRNERGGEKNQAELDSLFSRLDEVSEKIAEIDRQLDEQAGRTVRVDEKPAPAGEPGEADVSPEAAEPPGTPESKAETETS